MKNRRVLDQARDVVNVCLGSRLIEQAGRRLGAHRIRILAYHGVPDPLRFTANMDHLRRWYQPVSGRQVVSALRGDRELPPRAVWVTFDDGDPTVPALAQPVLDRLGITATMFICPGVVDTQDPYWWQVIEEARSRGLSAEQDEDAAANVTQLKGMPNDRRTSVVTRLQVRMSACGHPVNARQITSAELTRWVQQGHELGNHTWDHPCLDTCPAAEQRDQIVRAHRWLQGAFPGQPRIFAYPNGNWTPVAEKALLDLGYEAAGLFDHRFARLSQHPLRLSRLRVSADDTAARFRAILSGGHSSVFSALRRLGVRP